MKTQEEKQLLLKDLCARLPYKTYVKTTNGIGYIYAINTSQLIELSVANDSEYWSKVFNIDEIKPYLRPMSSMTEEEREEFRKVGGVMSHNPQNDHYAVSAFTPEAYDWLNEHYFDYRGLIEKGLALEAKEGMYKTE